MAQALRVEHCKQAMEFFIKFSTGSKAFLQYSELPDRVLDFHHTVTPDDQKGKGVAKVIVEEGMRYALDNNFKVLPSCSYVAHYLKSAPEQFKAIGLPPPKL